MRSRDAESDPLHGLLGGARLLLLFDGWCGVCTCTAEWVSQRDPAGHVLVLPSQTPGILESTGLTRSQADAAAWAIDRNGRCYAGAAAINRTLRELRPAWCRVVARLYSMRGCGWCEDRAYAWFARNRGHFARFGATPACERDGPSCTSEGT